MTPDSIPNWIWGAQEEARGFSQDTKDLSGIFGKVGRRVRRDVADLRGDGGYVAASANSAQDTVNEIAEVAKVVDTDVDTIRSEVKKYATDIGGVADALRRKRKKYWRLERQRREAPGGLRHEYDEMLRRVGTDIGSLVGDAEEHDRNHADSLRLAVEDLEGTVARLDALGWKPADPPTLNDMTIDLEEFTHLEVITDVAREAGLDIDEERIRQSLEELLEAGLIDAKDLQNPVLLTYVTNRPYGILPITEEWELSDISFDDDGNLKAFGMENWDPAVLAQIQKLLDEDARTSFAEYLSNAREAGHLPDIAPGHYTEDMAKAQNAELEEWRRNTIRYLMDEWNEKGERGFFSADLFDDLVKGYEDGSNSAREDALLLAITHSALNGPIPLYQMSGWDKFKDGAGKIATPISVLSTVFIWTPGGWVAKGVTWTARGLTAVDVADKCVVNADADQCLTTVAVAGVGKINGLKVKAIKKELMKKGYLTKMEERMLKGLETMYDMSDKAISVAVKKGMPQDFESSEELKRYLEQNAPQPDEGDGN